MANRDRELKEQWNETSSNSGIVFISPKKDRSHQYDEVIKQAKETFIERNKMYKDAFVVLGLIGTVSTLIGDVFRLKFMIYDSDDYGQQYRDNIRDKLLDIINQAVISIFVLDDNNYRGK